MAVPGIRLFAPTTPAQWADVRAIFVEYAQGLGFDLAFQGFEAELAELPGDYAPPAGAVLLASVDDVLAGCGAFRPCPDAGYAKACEMKRLYLRPAFRGLGLGRRIARALMDGAAAAGYAAMLLDTIDGMAAARGLYASLGFAAIPPYYDNPMSGVHYLRADLPATPR